MPYWLDFNVNVIQIMGGHLYIDKITPYVVLTINGSLWYLRPMVILTRCVISTNSSAIALTFGNLIPKIGTNTQFH